MVDVIVSVIMFIVGYAGQGRGEVWEKFPEENSARSLGNSLKAHQRRSEQLPVSMGHSLHKTPPGTGPMIPSSPHRSHDSIDRIYASWAALKQIKNADRQIFGQLCCHRVQVNSSRPARGLAGMIIDLASYAPILCRILRKGHVLTVP